MMQLKSLYIIMVLWLLLALQSKSQTFILPDTNFRKCLQTRYPTTINSTGQLIIAEAAKLTGTFNCSNFKITNADGIQYFTGLSNLQLLDNNISYVPSLVDLQNLVELDLSSNNLSILPDFSKLGKLTTLSVQKNNLDILPDLSGNNLITTLVAHSNNLTQLPNLDNMTLLYYINVSHNNLTSLPSLNKLTNLNTLYCWSNNLSSLPALDSLKNLQFLHAFFNNITIAPKLPQRNKVQYLYLNDNKINTLQDYSYCDSLAKVRIYNNYGLTFKEYLKLITKSGYDTIFKLSPQQNLQVGRKIMARENDSLYLSTGIDQGVAGVSYTWYKNGNLVTTVSSDLFAIQKASFSDSGNYTCSIKHPAFTNFSLATDTFKVSIVPCVEFSGFTFSTTEINCFNPGTLSINGDKTKIQAFELIGLNTGKSTSSSTGKFTGLSEPSYKLRAIATNGCYKEYTNNIVINQNECEETILSPDGDGISDSYYFPESGKVIIYDKRGEIVKSISIPGEWNGLSDKGKVASGFYVADINNGKRLVGITVLY